MIHEEDADPRGGCGREEGGGVASSIMAGKNTNVHSSTPFVVGALSIIGRPTTTEPIKTGTTISTLRALGTRCKYIYMKVLKYIIYDEIFDLHVAAPEGRLTKERTRYSLANIDEDRKPL